MSYEAWQLGTDRVQIRCTSGRSAHIVRHSDGTWGVEEDSEGKKFGSRGEALNWARQIAQDRD
jgi:hypothetical protein